MWALVMSSTGYKDSEEFVVLEAGGTHELVWSNPDGTCVRLHLLAVGTREEMEQKRGEIKSSKK